MNIKDIAKIAGVGVSTVSRVINNHPDVNIETRKKILAVIKEHDYVPNQSARLLKQVNVKNIGVIVKGVFNPFFSEMVKVIAEVIEDSKYTMILQHDDKDREDIDSLISFIKEHRLEGAIYLGGNFENIQEERLKDIDCKVVLLCSNYDKNKKDMPFSTVGIDDYHAAYEAMAYLLDQGHSELGVMIGELQDVGVGKQRLKGYRKALKEYDIPEEKQHIIEGQYNYKDAYEQTKKCIEQYNDVTAICCASDTMAVGAAKALLELGKTIGKGVAIIGFDGMDIAMYYNPTITTVKQPRKEIAKTGIELLIKLLQEDVSNKQVILKTEFIKGESC